MNDLFNRLESSYGVTVGTTHWGNPTLADNGVIRCPNLTSIEHQLTILQTNMQMTGDIVLIQTSVNLSY